MSPSKYKQLAGLVRLAGFAVAALLAVHFAAEYAEVLTASHDAKHRAWAARQHQLWVQNCQADIFCND